KRWRRGVGGKPLAGIGGTKKQVGSNAQPPLALPQSASVTHSTPEALTQCLVDCGPVVQSSRLVPRLAVRLIPSVVLKIDVAFSGMSEGATGAAPPPM